MAASASTHARPGIIVGPTSEFSLFFHVRAGEEREIRDAIAELPSSPGHRPGDARYVDVR